VGRTAATPGSCGVEVEAEGDALQAGDEGVVDQRVSVPRRYLPVGEPGVAHSGALHRGIRPKTPGPFRYEPQRSGSEDETPGSALPGAEAENETQEVLSKSGASPSVGSVAKIVELTSDPECDMDALAQVVSIDPVLGLRVLSLANSSAFALSRRMSDVRQAVALLGIRSLRNLALGLLVSDLAPQSASGQRLLEQSIRRGTACRLAAEHLGVKEVHEFFTAGLLLDVGLMKLARTDAKLAADLSSMASLSRSVRERALGLTPHAELSGKMARECGLPDATVAAIEGHHSDVLLPDTDEDGALVVAERVRACLEGDAGDRRRTAAVSGHCQLGRRDDTRRRELGGPVWPSGPGPVSGKGSGPQPRLRGAAVRHTAGRGPRRSTSQKPWVRPWVRMAWARVVACGSETASVVALRKLRSSGGRPRG